MSNRIRDPPMCWALCQPLSDVTAFTSHNNPVRQGLLTFLSSCKDPGLRKLLVQSCLACSWRAWGQSEALGIQLLARRHLPVGRVWTQWASHNASLKVGHETPSQKIRVVTSVGCEYRILFSTTKTVSEKSCGRRIWGWELQLWKK